MSFLMLLYILPKTLSIIQNIKRQKQEVETGGRDFLPPTQYRNLFVLVIAPQPSAPPFLLFYPRDN